ncbi:MAG: hypothetical protein A2283_15150 [Lentisphaerae bacterium RIFOXYA12_FULL_48_11]|nr:MAG: hypothetical protein A2283_15150 [Lentisphaerae bacterium RIFOXYA12_FULL_48_11]
MDRRNVLRIIGEGVAYLSLSLVLPGADEKPSASNGNQPNIIVILADDRGWADLGAQGVLSSVAGEA